MINEVQNESKPKLNPIDYAKNPKRCECCDKDIRWERRTNKYCSSSCAATVNNLKQGCLNKNGTKETLCAGCNSIITVNIRSKTKGVYCKKCLPHEIKHCKTCGQTNCKLKICLNGALTKSDIANYFGFDKSKLGTMEVFKEFERIKVYVTDLYTDYSMPVIAKMVGYDKPFNRLYSVLRIFFNIKFRTPSEQYVKCYNPDEKSKYIPFKTGMHTSWTNLVFIYRSSYELDYAKILDTEKIKYEYESLRFEYWDTQKLKYRTSIPDFYLPDSNTIVEIKSDWTYNEQNLKDRVKVYKELGYNFKLILNKKETPFEV